MNQYRMTKGNYIWILPFLLLLLGCNRQVQSTWQRGNLHTHSYWSDGDDYPEMIMDWYKTHDYQFAVLSDHNVLADTIRWKKIPNAVSHQETFRTYLKQYGEDWVEYEHDSENNLHVRLKQLEEYRPLFEEDGEFLIIQSEEISDSFNKKPLHMNATNIQEFIEPQGGNSVTEVIQNNLDAVKEQRERLKIPMFMHLNHPNFGWAVSVNDFMAVKGERFFEVYNGHPLVNNDGDENHPSTEEIWDILLTDRAVNKKPLLYGLAVDDAHNYHVFDSTKSNPGRGWVEVATQQLTAASIIQTMEKGQFYASTGVELLTISTPTKGYRIHVKAEEDVNYTIQFIGTKRSNRVDPGVILQETNGTRANYQFTSDDLYVRAKIISDRRKENPYKRGEVEVAWTQPITP